MRGGFGSRGPRSGGFERAHPGVSGGHDWTFEQALYPPTRQFHYFPPAMLQAALAQNGPRIPSAALELCQHAKPLDARQVLCPSTVRGSPAPPKLMFQETLPSTSASSTSSNTVGTLDDIVAWVDAARASVPKLPLHDDDVLNHIAQHPRLFIALQSELPPELRICFAPIKNGLSESEKKLLFKVKQHKKTKLEKPVRRGGVVVASTAAPTKVRPSKSTATAAAPSLVGVSLVDVSAAEVDGEERQGKRKRDDGTGEGSDGEGDGDDDGENSVSTVGDVDDDDDAFEGGSGGGGSGDELTF